MIFLNTYNGILMAVSNEEYDFIQTLGACGRTLQDMDQRDRDLARRLTSRGILKRINREGQTYYLFRQLIVDRD